MSDTGALGRVARGGLVNLVGTGVTQATSFVVLLLIAHDLGRAAVGTYAQAYAFLALLGLLALSGFRGGLTRYVAVHLAEGHRGRVFGTIRLGVWISVGASVVFGGVLWSGASWLARSVFDDPSLATPLRYVSFILPASSLSDAALSATQGFRTMRYYSGIGLIGEPLVRVVLTVVCLRAGWGLDGAFFALTVSSALAAVASLLALRSLLGVRDVDVVYELRELVTFSSLSWMASLASAGLLWADTIILGIFRSSADVGVYQVATRLVLLATLPMLPFNAALAPHVADLHRREHREELAGVYRAATGWTVRLSLPAFVVLVAFPREALRVFGRGFGPGVAVVLLLVVGKLVDAATGPCGLILNMSGRVGVNMADNVAVLVGNVALNLYAVPRHGAVGAAASWTACLFVVNVARVVQVHRFFGMWPFDTALVKAAGAAGAALLVALLVRGTAHGVALLFVGSSAATAAYFVAVAVAGISDHDRLLLRSFSRRRTARGAP